jgi:hypothetical protein
MIQEAQSIQSSPKAQYVTRDFLVSERSFGWLPPLLMVQNRVMASARPAMSVASLSASQHPILVMKCKTSGQTEKRVAI